MAKKIKPCVGQVDMLAAFDTTELDKDIIFYNDPRYPDFIARWQKSRFFALDIETYSISDHGDALNPFQGKIRLIQIALPNSDEVLIVDTYDVVPVDFLEVLKSTCESKTQHQIGANIQFDLTFLQHHYGIHSSCPYDIRILSILSTCGIKYSHHRMMLHSLKAIAERVLGIKVDKTEQTSDWGQPQLSNSQLNYAAKDVKVLCPIFLKLANQLAQWDNKPDLLGNRCLYKLTEIAKIECFAIPVFVEIVLTGQPINLKLAAEVRQKYVDAIEDIQKPVVEKIGLGYSAYSPKLIEAIKEHYGIELTNEVRSSKDTGTHSTKAANLFYHYTVTGEDALIRLALCRSLKKCLDSIDALVASATSVGDGYARGRYTSLGSTGSGRSTCGDDKNSSLDATNLQNIAGLVEHPIVDAYNLPPVRTIITSQAQPTKAKETAIEDRPMWLVDLSALR